MPPSEIQKLSKSVSKEKLLEDVGSKKLEHLMWRLSRFASHLMNGHLRAFAAPKEKVSIPLWL